VPKAVALDGDKPRRRRGGAVAVEKTAERSLAMRILLHSPKDMVAGAIAFAAVSAIITNALFLQAGRHPSPMFGGSVGMPMTATVPASLLPRPRPVEADARPADAKPLDAKVVEIRPVETRPSETKPVDPPTHLAKAPGTPTVASSSASTATANVMRPPAPIQPSSHGDQVGDLSTTSSHRVASVQRTLTEYGYGQLKPTGTVGSDTQAAIQKFERDRKIPVTGQMSDRLVRELTVMTGRPID
jgi:Putative peptidoglycan binding domain